MKYCEMCGKEISGRGPKKVCSSCRIIRDMELQQKWREENKKLKQAIKDHQLYEEKLEHRIIELEELLHGE